MKRQIFLIFSFLFWLSSNAQYNIDPTFGQGGEPYYWADLNSEDYYFDSTTDANDNIYFTGWTSSPTRMILGSLTAEGDLNLDFAPNYNQIHTIPGTEASNGYAVKLQSDNGIIVGGRSILTDAGVSSIFVAKPTPSGLVDASFGDNGYFIYAPDNADCHFSDLLISDDDEIFILGRYRAPSFGNFSLLIIKLTADGQLDTSFAEDGIMTFDTSSSNRYLTTGKILDNGQLLVAGPANGIKIMRINSDGTLDTTFGFSGVISTSHLSEVLAIEKYEDSFYAFSTGNGNSSFLYKFDETGLDLDYGQNGEADLEFTMFSNDAFFTEDGKVYFTGFYLGSSYVIRADTSGVLDTEFFTGSQAFFEISENNEALYSSVSLSDGSIVTSGQGIDLQNSGSSQDAIAYKLSENVIIDNISEENSSVAKAFPNPFTSILNIQSGENISKVQVLDMTGKKVFETEAKSSLLELDLSFLQSGIYIMRLLTSGEYVSQLVVKK